ncbi:ABC transporter permease [Paramicrobacterium agarici]|uniref:ABC-2 family transporter n=1 Tax=Paramicrobacterium agarici TaxID=630514 RepID=A0A2A9DVC7_9MICO|nr:ABC transporter permease [Microbacterium agarici]PFG30553.1 ABC-2 family transporter [Microbacterium agarici]
MSVIRAEWTKLRSIRSTWVIAAGTIVASTALGVLGTSDVRGAPPTDLPQPWDPTALSMKGILFVQLLIGMLGALSVTSEYDTGTIGTSLSMVPARGRLLAAKTLVATEFSLLTSEIAVGFGFAAGQASLLSEGLPAASILSPGVLGALIRAVLYLALVALIGVAIGVVTRSSTASLAVLVGVLLLVPALAPGLPGVLGDWFEQFWPITAGQAAYSVIPVDGALPPTAGLGILALAALSMYTVGHVAFRVRDV